MVNSLNRVSTPGIGLAGLISSTELSMSIMLVFRLLQGATNLSGLKMITEGCNVWFHEKFRLVLGAHILS